MSSTTNPALQRLRERQKAKEATQSTELLDHIEKKDDGYCGYIMVVVIVGLTVLLFALKLDAEDEFGYKYYYADLGVHKGATVKEVKAAYRKLAVQYHPDKNPDCTDCDEKFAKIAEAYQVLSNPEAKAYYDAYKKAPDTFLKENKRGRGRN